MVAFVEKRREATDPDSLGGEIVCWEKFFEGVKGRVGGEMNKADCILMILG